MILADAAARLMRCLPAENAHKVTIALAARMGPYWPLSTQDDPVLVTRAFGRDFSNPVGLAAGFDKNAEVPDAMLKLGFGFVECGTITPRAQSGNPRPRLFRLAQDGAVINRLGFNNDGMLAAAERLAARPRNGVVGINIGANKDSSDRIADYVTAFALLAPYADYVTVNISSPNTPGLRGLQNKDELRDLLARLTDARAHAGLSVPLLLKIAPDLDEGAADDIAMVVLESGIEGLIVSNTTISRAGLKSPLAAESGGLSGKPLFAPSTQLLRDMYARLERKITLVGVGGVSSGAEAYEKIRAGATLVQLYTALALNGPGLVTRIKRDLAACLIKDGFSNVNDAVGRG